MILREWRGRVLRSKSAAYLDFLKTKAMPDYAATPGHRSTWILVDEGPELSEFVLLSLWDSREAIRAFAGEDISRARYYPEDPGFLLEMPERLRHYDVAVAPRETTQLVQ